MGIITGIDISIAVILIGSIILGYMTGLVMKIAQLASLAAAYIAAALVVKLFSSQLGSFIYSKIPGEYAVPVRAVTEKTADRIAGSLIFTVVFIVTFIILRHVIKLFKIVDKIPVIGFIDHIGGAVAGFIVNFIIIYILAGIFFSVVPQEILDGWGITQEAVSNSYILQAFARKLV